MLYRGVGSQLLHNYYFQADFEQNQMEKFPKKNKISYFGAAFA